MTPKNQITQALKTMQMNEDTARMHISDAMRIIDTTSVSGEAEDIRSLRLALQQAVAYLAKNGRQ